MIDSGLVMLAETPSAVLGVSTGPDHMTVSGIALIPAVPRRGSFTVGIWVTSPFALAGRELVLDVQAKTNTRVWPNRLTVKMPTSVRESDHHIVLPPLPPRQATKAAAVERAHAGAPVRARPLPRPPRATPPADSGSPDLDQGGKGKHRKQVKTRWFRR